MNSAIDSLALEEQKKVETSTNTIYKNVHDAVNSNMKFDDIVSHFKFPKGVNSQKTLASVALAHMYHTTPERAYGMYDIVKEANHPELSHDEFVKKLYMAGEQLPEPTVSDRYYKKVAEEQKAEFEEYKTEREEAESTVSKEKSKGLLQSDESWVTESLPYLNEQARKHVDRKYFGNLNKNRSKERYFDALWEAKTPEDVQKAQDDYVMAQRKDRERYLNDIKSYEYQIENQTWDESFAERMELALKRSDQNVRGMVAKMAESVLQLVNQGPISNEMHDTANSWITQLRGQMDRAYARANAPELQRVGRTWLEKRASSLMENTPSMGLAALAAVAGFKAGGPWGLKASIFWTGGSMESWSTRTQALENGFSEQEANKRALINFVIAGGIEAAGSGVAKYMPSLQPAKKAFTGNVTKFGGSLTRKALEEIAEEVPQTVVELMCAGDVPYNDEGNIDYKKFAGILWETAQDAAVMSTVFSSVSKGKQTLNDIAFYTDTGIRRSDVLAYADDLNSMSQEADSQEVFPRAETPLDFENIDLAERYFAVELEDGSYQIWDADEGIQYNKAGEPGAESMNYDEAMEALDNANLNVHKGDPIHQLERFTTAQIMNGAKTPMYPAVQTMIKKDTTIQMRRASASELANYVNQLRRTLVGIYGEQQAYELIPEYVVNNLHKIPEIWDKGRIIKTGKRAGEMAFITRQEKIDAVNELRHILKLGQLYGEGKVAEIIRNEGTEFSHKIKPLKGYKHRIREGKIRGSLLKVHDMVMGTSKNDVFTSLSDLIGVNHVKYSVNSQRARTNAGAFAFELQQAIHDLEGIIGITKADKRKWSRVLGRKAVGHHAEEISMRLAGQAHVLTMGEIMFLNLAMMDAKLGQAIEDYGVFLPGSEIRGKVTEWEQQQLRDALRKNPKAQLFVDTIADFYVGTRGKAVNKSSVNQLGYPIVSEESFMPDSRKTNMEGKKEGMVKVEDLFARVSEDIRKAANFIYIHPHVQHMVRLLNSEDIRQAAAKGGRARHLERAIESYRAMENALPHKAIPLEGVINKLGANTARAILMNPRIVAMQAGSYMTYYFETDAAYLQPIRVPERLRKDYVFMNNRKHGFGSTASVVSEHGVRHMWMGKQRSDLVMEPLHQVDVTTASRSLNIAYAEMKDGASGPTANRWWTQYGADPRALFEEGASSPAMRQALYDRATYITYMTQPMFFPESRNLYLQQDAGLLREIARFRGYTDQVLRNIDRQLTLYRQGEIGFREMAKKVSFGMAWSSFWNVGLKFLFMLGMNEFRDEEEQKEMEFLHEFITSPLAMIPFVGWTLKGSVHELTTGEGYGPSDFSTITLGQLNHLKDSIHDIMLGIKYSLDDEQDSYGNWKSDKYIERGMREAAKDALILGLGVSGAPVDLIPETERKTKKKTKKRLKL